MGICLKGGTVVNADRSFCADVYCEDGMIKAVGANLDLPAGTQVIDVSGALVMPGGLDPHTHMQLPSMGTVSSDDFFTGTAAAASGGTTMIIDYVVPDKMIRQCFPLITPGANGRKNQPSIIPSI